MINTHVGLLLLLNKSVSNASDVCDALEAGHCFIRSVDDLPVGIYLTPLGAKAIRSLPDDAVA
jgi:hypothetical protein